MVVRVIVAVVAGFAAVCLAGLVLFFAGGSECGRAGCNAFGEWLERNPGAETALILGPGLVAAAVFGALWRGRA